LGRRGASIGKVVLYFIFDAAETQIHALVRSRVRAGPAVTAT
jgi:hypothetical protein